LHKFPYKWHLKDGYPAEGFVSHGLKVFGTFLCGGGSTMGYKLAGFNHLGGVEIDKQVADIYKINHCPKCLYNMDIRDFNQLQDIPEELFMLDVLDGSPPCSTFSMAGSREKAWGLKKRFREGQSKQTLDDLVFIYLDTIRKLKPKVALLENVSGLMKGNAKGYLKEIYKKFTDIGYKVQVFLLNAATMGVPQRRERVFVIGLRNDFDLPKLVLNFNEEPIIYKTLCNEKTDNDIHYYLTDLFKKYWLSAKEGGTVGKFLTYKKMNRNAVVNTLVASNPYYHYSEMRELSKNEVLMAGTFPLDYDFQDITPQYLVGMSVPPVMTAQISNQIYIQWLSKI